MGCPDPALPVHSDHPHPRLRVQQLEHRELASPRLEHEMVRCDVGRPGDTRRTGALAEGRPDGDGTGSRPGLLCRICGSTHDILRPRRGELAVRAASRAPRDRDGHGAELVLSLQRNHAVDLDDSRRPHDLLHSGRLQQRACATETHPGLTDRGRHGPRREWLSNLQGHHPAADRDGGGRGRHARFRAVFRRGDRDHSRRGRPEHPAAVDLRRRSAGPASA